MAKSKVQPLVYRHISFRSTPFIFAGVLTSLTAILGLILSGAKVSATNPANTTFNVEVSAACSLTISQNAQTVIVNPGGDGTIGTANVKSVCNDPAGLAVYAVGYSGDSYGNNKLSTTINGTTYEISSAAAGSPTGSQWNMTLTPVTGTYAPSIVTGYDSAHAVPQQYTKVAYRNNMTDSGVGATGANFTATFNAHVSTEQAAGTYTGKVKFLLVHPSTHDAPVAPVAVPHQICYYGNGEDEGSMSCQSAIDVGGSTDAISVNADVQLRASNFSRAGFGFTGWNTKEDGTGTQYGPMETITFTQEMYDNGLVLFANWKAAETGVTMQTFDDSASPYSTAAIGTVIALRDIRDDDVYAVAKLADGKWWMIENLRLDYDANITTSNTQSNNGQWGGVFAGLAEPESANFSSSTTANSLYTTDTSSTDLRVITGSNLALRFPRYNNANTASRAVNSATSDANVYGYGNYYTWAAAVADTNNNATGLSITSTSLCPTGWRLPIGGSKNNFANSDWWNLTRAIVGSDPANYDSDNPYYTGSSEGTDASKAMRSYPENFLYSGNFSGSSASVRGTIGGYWSSTVGIYSNYYESLSNNKIAPGTDTNNYSFYGRSVRCLAD